jgi:hypothetical protein
VYVCDREERGTNTKEMRKRESERERERERASEIICSRFLFIIMTTFEQLLKKTSKEQEKSAVSFSLIMY